MKAKWISAGIVAGVIIVMQTTPTHGQEAPLRLGIGIGVMESSSYHSYMSTYNSDGDAAYAWLNFNISCKIRINDNWAVVPAVDLYATGNGGGFENRLEVPSVNVRYSFRDKSTYFLQAGPNYIFAQTDKEGITDREGIGFKGGGFGGVVSLGYAFKIIEWDLGYNYAPVDVTRKQKSTTENFGGFFIRCSFHI